MKRWVHRRVFRPAVNTDLVQFVQYLLHLFSGGVAYAVVSRRVTLLLGLVLGLAFLAIGLAGQAAAPFVVYPFI